MFKKSKAVVGAPPFLTAFIRSLVRTANRVASLKSNIVALFGASERYMHRMN